MAGPSIAILLGLAQLPAATAVTTYEAEDQVTTGTQIGPDVRLGTPASQASKRRGVWLAAPSDVLQIVLRKQARGLTIRYSLRDDHPEGAALTVRMDGQLLATVELQRRFIAPGRFWDEARVLLPQTLPAGARIRFAPATPNQRIAVDLVETELVGPPEPRPAGAISLGAFGTDGRARLNARTAFVRGIAAARRTGRPLYVPPGRYRVDGHLVVDHVAIVGGGSWYTIVSGHHLGFYSRPRGSSHAWLRDMAIESDVVKRQDRLPLAAIGGTFSESRFERLYLHHAKVGLWLDGPARDLVIAGNRITDQAADGINLHRGIANARVSGNLIRNSGDDGIASWSDRLPNTHIVIRGNIISSPRLANGIALYGGDDITVSKNVVADTITEGGGIHLGTRFRSTPFGGTIRIEDNRLVRSGSLDPHWHFGVGSIWLYALERPIAARIVIAGNRVEQPRCEALQLMGDRPISGVEVDGLRIIGPVTSPLSVQTTGEMRAAGLVLSAPSERPEVEVPPGFRLTMGAENSGWTARPVERTASPSCL